MFDWIGIILVIAGYVYLGITTKKFLQNEEALKYGKKELINLLISAGTSYLGFLTLVISNAVENSWKMNAFDYFSFILGFLMFTLFSMYLYFICALRLYKPEASKNIRIKYPLYILLLSLITVFSFLLAMEGIANYFIYPLPNGILINSNGISLVPYTDHSDGLKIPFYGLCILGGALLCYYMCDYKFYKQYGKHGMLDSTFFVAFPAGLVGARLWYCFVLEPEYFLANPGAIIEVWNGGLAIMGGALLGIIAGVTWVILVKKEIKLIPGIDSIVPTILLAQCIGRWGNFFNHEVYGANVPAESWSFLPTFIQKHMSTNFLMGEVYGGEIYIPLFLIESLTNLCGYFVIAYLVGYGLKKYIKPLDLGACYLIWYGITRAIMEPLRSQSFEYNQSWISAFLFIGGGLLIILANHLIRYLINKRKVNA